MLGVTSNLNGPVGALHEVRTKPQSKLAMSFCKLAWNKQREGRKTGSWSLGGSASSEGHRACGWHVNMAWIRALNGRRCGWSPVSSTITTAEPVLSCPSRVQRARPWSLSLQILGQKKWMVSQETKTCRGLKRLASGYISQTWTSWQSVISEFCYPCSNPQPIKPQAGGLTSRNLSFPLALLKYNNQTCLTKMGNWFYIKSRGDGNGRSSPCNWTSCHSVPFSKRRYQILYIL